MTETICQIGCIMVTGTRINPEGISLKVFCHTCYELKFAIVYIPGINKYKLSVMIFIQ